MGKRMLNLLAIGITLFSYKLYGQTQINFPVNGAVFQQNSSGQHTIRLGGQVKHNDNKWYIRIRKRSGDDSWDDINIEQREISLSSVGDGTNTRYFFITGNTAGGPLIRDKGFYKATLFRKGFLGKKHFYGNVEFGIGDVYYVAGQSNAAGYGGQGNNGFAGDDANLTWEAEVKFMDDNAISTTGNTGVVSPMTRVLSTRIDENNAFPGESLGNQQPISIGTVYKQFEYRNVSTLPGFSEFKNGATDNNPNSKYTDQNRVPIYPNGYNSWCWAPLGYLFATDGTGNASQKYNGTPTLWFNAASAGSAMVDLVGGPGYNYNAWSRNPGSENSVYAKLGNTLRNFGSVYGAKAVLWTQGETDAARLWLNEASNDNYILDNYTTQLNNIIGYSREAATGLTNHSSEAFKSLNWFLSKTSLFPTPDGSVGGNGTTHLSSATINGSIPGFVSDPIKARQIINTSNKVFEGPNTDNHLTRATGAKIHFTGSTLQNLANEWYTKIAFVNSSASVEPAEPLGFSSISKMGNNYTLTVNNSISGTHFFWQKNNDANMRYPHIGSPLSNETTSNISHPILASAGDVLHCYVFKNGRFHPVAPYVVPGDSEPLKILNADKSSLNFLPSGGSHQVRVIYENVSWQVDSKPSWLSESYNEDNNTLTYTASSYSGSRSGTIVLKDEESSLTYNITVSQGTFGPDVSLTTLTPSNNSSEWSGYASARFDSKTIDGNTIQVSGVPYYQGIGTHADSRMVFNLSGGGYTTFYGKAGRSDDADNGSDLGKVQFSIKTDGSTVWTSGVHGNTTGAESFSVNVNGKSTLELLVNQYSDGIYFDHANWIDVYLSGGGTPCSNASPAGVSASPASHGPGGGNTTLTASCSSGATVQWSTGHTGNSVTVFTGSTTTYTAKCVSGSCTESSPVAVTVTVGTGCSALSNDLTLGYWTVTGHPLVAKYFHGNWWLVQKINNSPEQFLVRGSEMLTRGDVTMPGGSYSHLVNCFAYTYSDYGGLQTPSSVTFPTPPGYNIGYEPDGTPYYTFSGTPPSGCTDAYLTSSWTYASAAGSTGSIPKIGQSFDGNNMTMGSVNYGSSYPGTGIGTHATSEIIYDLGASHSYTHFKSTVGKDNEAVCGEDRMVFKVYNNATNALLGTSPVVGTPSYGLPQTAEMSVPIAGVRYLKLVVEDGGDNIYCDHANWARARLACSASGRMSATDSVQTFFSVYPNVSKGEFTVEVELQADEEVRVSLISSSGAVYQQESYKGLKGRNVLKFNAAKVMSGLYHVRVSTREKVESKTVVIEK